MDKDVNSCKKRRKRIDRLLFEKNCQERLQTLNACIC